MEDKIFNSWIDGTLKNTIQEAQNQNDFDHTVIIVPRSGGKSTAIAKYMNRPDWVFVHRKAKEYYETLWRVYQDSDYELVLDSAIPISQETVKGKNLIIESDFLSDIEEERNICKIMRGEIKKSIILTSWEKAHIIFIGYSVPVQIIDLSEEYKKEVSHRWEAIKNLV